MENDAIALTLLEVALIDLAVEDYDASRLVVTAIQYVARVRRLIALVSSTSSGYKSIVGTTRTIRNRFERLRGLAINIASLRQSLENRPEASTPTICRIDRQRIRLDIYFRAALPAHIDSIPICKLLQNYKYAYTWYSIQKGKEIRRLRQCIYRGKT